MKHYSLLTLLSSVVFLASFSLQAEVVHMAESVSRVVYQGDKAVATVEPSVVPVTIKPFHNKPKVVITESVVKLEAKTKQVGTVQPLPLKITPRLGAGVDTAALPVAVPVLVPVLVPLSVTSPLMPTTIPVNPILNTRALAHQEESEELEEPSLFSAISDWFSVKPVKPWQKGTLAKKAMKPGGEVPEFDFFSEKVFAYKQGSIGGNGVGGGGCGCN
ncbi:DUF4266 domain-containing protein [Moritella dasanensis]|uniref:DUF4266 domain-containing protein n=1 Tax=Moritella dasanensis TaxID=428031 RepID=UPI0002EDB3AF|nr:DUF4266 domain-containing protein [Moritella dasanensis]